MPHSRSNRTYEALEHLVGESLFLMARLPRPLLLLTLIFMPLVYDGGQAWWLPLLAIITTVTLVTYSLPVWWHGRILPQPYCSPVLILFLIPLAAALLQLIPDPPALDGLAPTIADLWSRFNHLAVVPASPTLSLAPDATTERALTFAICAVFCFLLTNTTHGSGHLKGLLLTITCAALGNAIMVYIEMGSISAAPATYVSGAFMNRNHFAFLMMMGTMTALGLLTIITSSSLRDECLINRNLWEKMALPLVLVIFILLTAQVVSLSRGAFLASTIAFAIFAILWLAAPTDHRHRRKRQLIMAYATLLALALAFALFFSLDKLSDRYKDLTKQDFTMDDRWMIWQDAIRLIRDVWQTGVGQGAFPYAIQPYETGHFTANLLGHAHNDILEFIAETGVPIALIMAILILILMTGAFRRAWRKDQGRTQRWTTCAALVAIIGAFIHECFDFNLQAWANMLVFTALAATAAAAARRDNHSENHEQSSLTQHRRKRLTTRLPWLFLAILALAALPQEIKFLKAGIARAELMHDLERENTAGTKSKQDYHRRMALLHKGQHPLLSHHYLHRQKALILATYAEQQRLQAPKLMQRAARQTALAAARLPTDGNTAFLNATFHRHAITLGDNTLGQAQLEALYDWAIDCQPNITSTLENIGMVAFQDFLDAHGQDNQSIIRHFQNRARNILLKCLRLEPDNLKIYDALFYLFGNIPELLEATPENYDAMITLAQMLIRKKRPQDALNLAQHIMKRSQTLRLTTAQIIETLSITAAAQEILARENQRNETWEKLWRTVRHRPVANQSSNTATSPTENPKQLLAELESEAEHRVLTTDEIITIANAYSLLGRKTDAVIALLQLSYQIFAPPDTAQLQQALDIIGNPNAISNPFFVTRAVFLKQALTIMKAEQTKHTQELTHATQQLKILLQEQAERQTPWLNRHLIPIFIARANLVCGHVTQAIRYLRQALAICPFNVIAMKLIQQTDPKALRKNERQLLELMNDRKYPIALFKSGLGWVTTKFTEDTISEPHQKQQVTYLFSCYRDILHPIRFTMTYYDQEGSAFSDDISFENGRELTFRIGELIAVRKTWQPFVKTLAHSTRRLTDGTMVIKATDQALPMPITHAFNVKLNDKH